MNSPATAANPPILLADARPALVRSHDHPSMRLAQASSAPVTPEDRAALLQGFRQDEALRRSPAASTNQLIPGATPQESVNNYIAFRNNIPSMVIPDPTAYVPDRSGQHLNELGDALRAKNVPQKQINEVMARSVAGSDVWPYLNRPNGDLDFLADSRQMMRQIPLTQRLATMFPREAIDAIRTIGGGIGSFIADSFKETADAAAQLFKDTGKEPESFAVTKFLRENLEKNYQKALAAVPEDKKAGLEAAWADIRAKLDSGATITREELGPLGDMIKNHQMYRSVDEIQDMEHRFRAAKAFMMNNPNGAFVELRAQEKIGVNDPERFQQVPAAQLEHTKRMIAQLPDLNQALVHHMGRTPVAPNNERTWLTALGATDGNMHPVLNKSEQQVGAAVMHTGVDYTLHALKAGDPRHPSYNERFEQIVAGEIDAGRARNQTEVRAFADAVRKSGEIAYGLSPAALSPHTAPPGTPAPSPFTPAWESTRGAGATVAPPITSGAGAPAGASMIAPPVLGSPAGTNPVSPGAAPATGTPTPPPAQSSPPAANPQVAPPVTGSTALAATAAPNNAPRPQTSPQAAYQSYQQQESALIDGILTANAAAFANISPKSAEKELKAAGVDDKTAEHFATAMKARGLKGKEDMPADLVNGVRGTLLSTLPEALANSYSGARGYTPEQIDKSGDLSRPSSLAAQYAAIRGFPPVEVARALQLASMKPEEANQVREQFLAVPNRSGASDGRIAEMEDAFRHQERNWFARTFTGPDGYKPFDAFHTENPYTGAQRYGVRFNPFGIKTPPPMPGEGRGHHHGHYAPRSTYPRKMGEGF